MVYLTLSIEGEAGDAQRNAVDDAVIRQGGSALWRWNAAVNRSYALLELPERYDRESIAAPAGGALYDRAIIALAVFPAVPEALPHLLEALADRGAPAGVLAASLRGRGVIVEWDPEVTKAEVILHLIDVELRRFESGRTAELLAPIPPAVAAALAATGLQTPQIDARRILELRIENA